MMSVNVDDMLCQPATLNNPKKYFGCPEVKPQHADDVNHGVVNQLSHLIGDTTDQLKYHTIGQTIADSACRYADRVAISFYKGHSLTYDQVFQKLEALAAAFVSLGLEKGDHVALWGFNSIEWYLAFLAAAKAGLVSVNLNPLFEGPELHSCLTKADVKALIMDEELGSRRFYDILRSVVPEVTKFECNMHITSDAAPMLRTVVMISKKTYRGTYQWEDLYTMATPEERIRAKNREAEMEVFDPCSVQFTSGTTSSPKAVLLTHFAVVNNSFFTGKCLNVAGHESPKSCIPVPLFHSFGCVAAIMASIHFGVTLVLPAAKFSPTKTIDCITDEKCTVMYGTPTMYIDLLTVLNKRVTEDPEIFLKLSCLQRFFSGGAVCLPEVIRKLKYHFTSVKFTSGYGMTEILSPFMSRPDDDDDRIMTTVGRIMDHQEVKLVDSNGDMVPLGAPGELCCRSYSIMKGYYRDAEKTRMASDEDGWFHTGDRFVFLADGYAQIIGRIKETIIRGGENIEPKEIEEVLIRHPDIVNAQVYGVSCPRLGEVVAASIIKLDTSSLDDCGVRSFCRGIIAPYKIPQYVMFLKEFPKTVSGKIQKFRLRQMTEQALHKG